jgi:hypothetical protein
VCGRLLVARSRAELSCTFGVVATGGSSDVAVRRYGTAVDGVDSRNRAAFELKRLRLQSRLKATTEYDDSSAGLATHAFPCAALHLSRTSPPEERVAHSLNQIPPEPPADPSQVALTLNTSTFGLQAELAIKLSHLVSDTVAEASAKTISNDCVLIFYRAAGMLCGCLWLFLLVLCGRL